MTVPTPYPEAGSTQIPSTPVPSTPVPSAPIPSAPAPGAAGGVDVSQMSVGELVGKVTNDLSTLLRQELALAKAEMKAEAKKAGTGAGLLGGAGVAGLMLLVFASLTLMFLLDLAMPLWAAALIVTVLWGAAAAVLALQGKKKLQDVDPTPHQTVETLKEDVQWARRTS